MYEYKVTKVIKVIDGDTVDVEISLGFGIKASLRIRVADVDTYEMYGPNADIIKGPEAKKFTENWLYHRVNDLVVRTRKGSQSTVGIGDGAFGRWIGEFAPIGTNHTLAQALIFNGHTK